MTRSKISLIVLKRFRRIPNWSHFPSREEILISGSMREGGKGDTDSFSSPLTYSSLREESSNR